MDTINFTIITIAVCDSVKVQDVVGVGRGREVVGRVAKINATVRGPNTIPTRVTVDNMEGTSC